MGFQDIILLVDFAVFGVMVRAYVVFPGDSVTRYEVCVTISPSLLRDCQTIYVRHVIPQSMPDFPLPPKPHIPALWWGYEVLHKHISMSTNVPAHLIIEVVKVGLQINSKPCLLSEIPDIGASCCVTQHILRLPSIAGQCST